MALDGSLLEPSVDGFVNKGKVRNDDGDGSASDETDFASKDCQSADDLEEGELEEDDEPEEEVESVKLQPPEPAASVVATEPEGLKESPAPAQSRLPATIPSLLDLNIPPPDSRFLKALGKTLPTWAKGASYRRKRYPGSDGEDSDDEGVDDTYKSQKLRKRRQNARRMRDRYAGYGLDDDDEMDDTDHQKWYQTSSNIAKKKVLSKDTCASSPPGHSPYASPPGPYDSPSEPEAEDDIALATKVDTKEQKSKANEDTAISKNSGEDSTARTVSGGDESLKLSVQSAADHCSNTHDVHVEVEVLDSAKRSKSPANDVDLLNVEEHKTEDTQRPENTFSSFGRRVDKNVLSSTRQQDSQLSEQQPLTKKRKLRLAETPWEDRPVCRFFQEGKCNKGSECPFNHTGPQNPPSQKKKHPILCRHYQRTGDCNRGSECRYYHETWPCPAFHKTGCKGCPDGERCKYSHADLTDETRPLVEQQENQPSEEGGEPKKKPLLGNFQQTSENKIPSLFDLDLPVQPVKGGSAGLQMGPRGFPIKPGLLGIRPQPRARMGSMQLMRMGAGTGFFRGPRPPRMPHQVVQPSQNFDTDTRNQHTMSSNTVIDDGSVEKLVNGANSDVTMATMDALHTASPASIESHQKPEYLVTVSHPALQSMHGSLQAAASSIADPNLCAAPSFNSLNSSAQSNASMQSGVTFSSVPPQSALLPEPTIVAGVDLTQLQPAQRELFLRLNQSSQKPQQQSNSSSSIVSAQQAETIAAPLQSNVEHVANVVHTNDASQSTVTSGGTFHLSKINDLLKVLSQQPATSAISSNGTDGSQQLPLAPVFDIHQVLSAITHMPSTVSAVSTGPVKATAAAIQEPGDAELEVNGLRATIEYNPKPYDNLGTVIPADMVLDDPRWDEDPRVQRWRREVELGRMPRREVRNKPAVSAATTAVPQRDPRRRNDTPAAAVVTSAATQPNTSQVPVEQQQMHIQQFVQQMINMQQPPPAAGFPSQLMASTAPPRIPVPLLMSAPSVMFPGNMVGMAVPPRTTGMMPVPLVDVRAAPSAFPAVAPQSIGAAAPVIGMPAVPQGTMAPSIFPPIFNPRYPPPFMMPRGPLQGNVPVIPPTMHVPPPTQPTAVAATAAAGNETGSVVVSLHHDSVKTVDEHSATPLHAVTTYVSPVLNESVFETAEVKSDQSRKFVDSRFKKQTLPNIGDPEVIVERKLPSNDNPNEETALESVRDRKVLQFQSPLAETGSTRLSGGYNRPPNKRYQELIEQNGNRDSRRLKTSNNVPHSAARKTGFGVVGPIEPDADMPHLIPAIATPTLPVTKCPPTLMNEDAPAAQSAAEGSLKDMFKTIDPTASPFC